MKPFSLSFRAARSLDRIADYSFETFGKLRGDAYVADLLTCCRNVAAGRKATTSCRIHFGEDLRTDLRFARAGRHYVVVVEMLSEFLIIDFIHQSADVGGRLGGPYP
jgi:toxin ParE1/3/4